MLQYTIVAYSDLWNLLHYLLGAQSVAFIIPMCIFEIHSEPRIVALSY